MTELLQGVPRNSPVDVDRLAAQLNADVRTRPLSPDLSGLMQRTESGVIIGLNSTHNPRRRRFSLAHELGHWLLDHGDSVVDTVRRRDGVASLGTEPEEIEANEFAASLLMPAPWLKEELKDRMLTPLDTDEIGALASRYDVSVDAMTFRLINLRLLRG